VSKKEKWNKNTKITFDKGRYISGLPAASVIVAVTHKMAGRFIPQNKTCKLLLLLTLWALAIISVQLAYNLHKA